jgi:hypothetical protein
MLNQPGEEEPPALPDDWAPVPPEHYIVNRCDTTSFPLLGRAVTTVTLRRDPAALAGFAVARTTLLADLVGVEDEGDGSGEPVENPARVVETILTRFGGLDPEDDVDAASFDEAAERLGRARFAFALDRVRDLPSLVSDLAFQATAAFRFREGRAHITVLPRSAGAPGHELDAASRAEGTLVLGWDDGAEVRSAVEAAYREAGEERSLLVTDADAVETWGLRSRRISLWAYGEAPFARDAARFWLERWKAQRRRVTLTTFLQSLAVEPGDVVALTADELGGLEYRAEVECVRHRPGSSRDGRIDAIELEMRLPVWAGCEGSCELACETGCESACEAGCETGCESACELSCEAACQSLCELDCAAAAESLCSTDCMATACEVACEVFVTSLDGWGCGACETDCQVCCEAVCESACETACETGCETACEVGCETECETGCETHCQVGCQLGGES